MWMVVEGSVDLLVVVAILFEDVQTSHKAPGVKSKPGYLATKQ
jgi:hypothetical protein